MTSSYEVGLVTGVTYMGMVAISIEKGQLQERPTLTTCCAFGAAVVAGLATQMIPEKFRIIPGMIMTGVLIMRLGYLVRERH